MSQKLPDSIDPYAIILADLEAKKAEIDAAITAILRVRGSTAPATARDHVVAPLTQMLADTYCDPFKGMALPEASAKQLEIAKVPQTAREIWSALESAGYKSTSEDPVHAVQWALNRRAKKVGDVVLIGYGKWALRTRYTEAELEMLRRSIGGMPNRDRDVHITKTKNAIATLKSRGVRWGRPISISVQQWVLFLQAREAGAGVKEAASTGGFSPAVAVNLGKNYAIDQWKPGDQWPPYHLRLEAESKPDLDAPTQMRLVP